MRLPASNSPFPTAYGSPLSNVAARPGDSQGTPRILVVEWKLFFATTVARCAEDVFPTAEIVVCHSAAEARAEGRAKQATLGLFGLTFPDMDGLDLLAEICRERSTAARLMVVSDRDDERSRNVLRTVPIDGYFDCGAESQGALRGAMLKVGSGGRYFSASFEGETSRLRNEAPLSALLTATQLQVFAVIGDGTDDRCAAGRLNLSEKTIHTHRQRIMYKLGVQTRAELMLAAIRRGVVRVTEKGVLRPGFEAALAAWKSGR
jgi:DNA-binding NarL/FixJ family response regulator